MYKLNTTRLKEEMWRCGLKQVELAEKVGVTEVSMSRYATGERMPRIGILYRIAEALDTTPEYLTGTETIDHPDVSFAKVRVAVRSYGNSWTHEQRKELMNLLIDAGEERGEHE